MNEKKNQLLGILGINLDTMIPKLKDTAIFAGWIAGLILIASLCWFLTGPVRNSFLLSSVNRVLEQSGYEFRLGTPVSVSGIRGGLGTWFTLRDAPGMYSSTSGKIYIFMMSGGGAFFPCAALVYSDGLVDQFVPLNSLGKRIMEQLSPGVLNIYARRIEGANS